MVYGRSRQRPPCACPRSPPRKSIPRRTGRILARLREGGARQGDARRERRLLARAAADIAVGEVVTALEVPLSLVGCVPDDGACARADSCASRIVWRRLDSAISGALNSITLEDLTREAVSP